MELNLLLIRYISLKTVQIVHFNFIVNLNKTMRSINYSNIINKMLYKKMLASKILAFLFKILQVVFI